MNFYEYDEFRFGPTYIGQSKFITFKKKYNKIPYVIVGEGIYYVPTTEWTILQISRVTTEGFTAVVANTTGDYSPIFNYIVLESI